MKKLMLAAVLTAFAMPAFAQMPPFDAIDTDGNGTVSQAEAKAAMPDMTDEWWKKADANSDGSISKEEMDRMGGL
jgi:opacity protein-like surface antigen